MKAMKQRFRRICSILLAAVLIVTSIPGMETTAFAAQDSAEGIVNYATGTGTADSGDIGGEETGYVMDFDFDVLGTSEEQVSVMEQIKVQSVDGTEDLGMSIPLNGEESISFHVEIPEGYTIISIYAQKKKEYKIVKDYENNNFTVSNRWGGVLGTEDIHFRVVVDKIRDKELYIEYPETTIEKLEVVYGDNIVKVTDGRVMVPNTEDITVSVKAKENYQLSATYESEIDSYPMYCEPSLIEEDGTYFYEMGRVVYDTGIVFRTDETVKLTYNKDENISAYFYDDDSDVYISDGLVLAQKIGRQYRVWLSFDESLLNDNNLVVTNTLSDGTSEDITVEYDYDNCEYYYSYRVTGEADISIKLVPKTLCNITFDAENATIYKYTYSIDDLDYYQGEQCNELSVYAGEEVYFGVCYDSKYELPYVSPTDNEEDALKPRHTWNEGNLVYSIYKYAPVSDTTMTVKLTEKETYHIAIQSEHLSVYKVIFEEEGYHSVTDEWTDTSVYAGETVLFAVNYDPAYKLEYVSLTDSTEGELECITKLDEDSYYVYEFTPTSDTTVYVNTAIKNTYTLTFELDRVSFYGNNFDTDERVEYELLEGAYEFFLYPEDSAYELDGVTVSDASGTKELEGRYEPDMGCYSYRVTLDGNKTVSATVKDKTVYTVELNSENVTLNTILGYNENEENVYKVYNNTLFSFRTQVDEGYKIEEVRVNGDEGYTVSPVEWGDTNVYSVIVDENMVIDVVTAKKTSYSVTAEITNATLTSTNPTDDSGNYTFYGEDSFIFTVEADDGYVVDEVTVNEETISEVYDPISDSRYYQVFAEEDIKVSVTAVVEEDKQIIFDYEGNDPDTLTVWSESGQTYTPSEGSLTVPSNEVIWFDVLDPSMTTGVVASDSEEESRKIYRTSFNGQTGYCLGNVTKDTQVSIAVGDTYRISFERSFDERIVPLNGVGTFTDTTYVALNEGLDFKIVQSDPIMKLKTVRAYTKKPVSGSAETGIYHFVPLYSPYVDEVVEIIINSFKKDSNRYTFYYDEEKVNISVSMGDKKVSLVDGSFIMPNTELLSVEITSLEDEIIELHGSYSMVEPDSIKDDGTYVYNIPGTQISGYTDNYFTVNTFEYHTVDFQIDNGTVYLGTFNDDGLMDWVETEGPIKVKKGYGLNMKFTASSGYELTGVNVTDKTAGSIKEAFYEDYENYHRYPYYRFIPQKDATVNASTRLIPQYTYNFVYDSTKVDLYIGEYIDYEYYEINWIEGSSEYKKPISSILNIPFRVVPKEGYTVASVTKTGGTDNNVSQGTDWNTEVEFYFIGNSGDATITIVAEEAGEYELTFEYTDGIEGIDISSPDRYASIGYGGSQRTVTMPNTSTITIWPYMQYFDDGETKCYNITSVKADGIELKAYASEDMYYYKLPYFNKDTTITIETAVNKSTVNTTSFAVDGEEGSYKIFQYQDWTDEEGNTGTKKVYLENEYCLKARNHSIGVEAVEGYTISKVEYSRGGRVWVLTPDEDGMYNIFYPLSMGMAGTMTVYTIKESVPEETYEALPLSLVNADGTTTQLTAEDGIYSVNSDAKYVAAVQGSIQGKAVLTKAEITSESPSISSTVAIGSDSKQADIIISKADEGKMLLVNLYVEETEKLVASYMIYVNESKSDDNAGGGTGDGEDEGTGDGADEDTVITIDSVTVDGITEGKVSLNVDTAKEFELTVNPETVEASRIGVEVIPAEGQPADIVKAEIADGKLRLTTAPVAAGENVATVKLYDSAAKEKTYIPGGTFTVSTVSPAALTNGEVQVEINKLYDVAFTLGVFGPEGLSELVNGKYYYKVVVTPQGENIPEEIKKATEKPQYFEKDQWDYQNLRVFVNTNDFGGGQAWTYDVTVTLVQTDGDGVPDGTTGTQVLYESKESGLSNITTKNPYFSEKVIFYEIEKQVYTAQRSVAIAQFALEEGTSYPDIEKIEDITELNGKGSALRVYADGNYIFVNVPSDAMVGKHTIEVTIGGPASMNKTTGTYEINVIKGIENMQVFVPSVSIYKQANKAATIKATVTYNQDMAAPKTKKATWEVVKPNGEAFVQGDALYGMLTVKNGKVTVNKTFVPTETESDNQFRVKAKAADYEENTVYALSDVITLTSKPAEIGVVYVVSQEEGGYQVVVKDGDTITTDKLENAFVAVLKKDAEEKDFYTAEELNNLMLSTEILTYKSSNKAVTVQKEDTVTLSATKAAKNVKLTVSTTDGGKKKAVMKFTIAYQTPEALALEVLNDNQQLAATGTKEISFAGTTNTRLLVKVKEKSGETWTDLKALSNYKLSVKNGKIVASDNVKGIYEVIVTAKEATVTLDNKTTGAKAKDAYKITNTAYSPAKAPKAKTKDKLVAGVMANRSVTYTLSGSYDYKGKYVLVETDYISRSKKEEAYSQFEAVATNLNVLVPITSDGKFTLTFNENQIPAGSYKLKLTYGTGSNVDTFIADAKPATVTLKAVKPKVTKGSYKPVTTYKMEAKAGTSVALTGKGKNLVENSLVYYDLKNANIKGKQNEFLSYFELKDNTLCLKSDLTDEDIAYLKSADGKNNLTGYVTYTVSYGDDGYGNPKTVTKTVKLTIKLK